MEKERLLRLVTLLGRHRDNGVRFNLGVWQERKSKQRNWCGTQACAVGLAMSDRVLRRHGLNADQNCWDRARYNPEYLGLTDWDAVCAFFDIDEIEAHQLFSLGHYIGKTNGNAAARRVAKRIKEFIANKEQQGESQETAI